MPRTTLRPHTITWGLPGNAHSVAHAGQPSSDKPSHHKLHAMDPGAAQDALLSPLADATRPLRRLTEAEAALPAPPPRTGLSKLAGRLLGVAAQAAGLKRGEPAAHAALLRYAGTRPATANRPQDRAAQVAASFTRQLAAGQAVLDAKASLHAAEAALEVLQANLDRLQGELARSARRAGNLAERLHAHAEQAAELATVHNELHATTQLRQSTAIHLDRIRAELATQPPRPAPGSPSLAELLQHEAAEDMQGPRMALLAAQAALLEDIAREADASLGTLQQRAAVLAREQAAMAPQAKEVHRLAGLNEAALWQADTEAEELRALLAPARARVAARAEALAAAEAEAERARGDHQAADLAGCAELLATGGPFAHHPEADTLVEALATWQAALPERLANHGAEALPATLAAQAALQALAAATGGDAGQAAALALRLRSMRLVDLLPLPGASGTTAVDELLLRLAGLLAAEPSGIQLLDVLAASGGEPPSAIRQEAMRIGLLATQPRAAASEADEAWRHAALRAAARMVHADDPAQALLDASAHERAAYRGWRNGYPSTEPGSGYDKANRHLRKLAAWLHKSAAASPAARMAPPTPLDALRDGLTLAAANALPTPRRMAAQALQEGAGHLTDYLGALRALRPRGAAPSDAELGWQALAYHLQWHDEGTDLATARLGRKDWQAIHARQRELQASARREAQHAGLASDDGPAGQPALGEAWRAIDGRDATALDALGLLRRHLPEPAPTGPDAAPAHAPVDADTDGPDARYWRGPDARYWRGQEAALRQRLHQSVATAERLMRDGDPARVVDAPALLALSRDMIEHLEWRDRLRLVGQQVRGANLGPLSSALAAAGMATGIGVKLVAGVQQSDDQVMEVYMGRTGLYLQLGEQRMRQVQGGAGVNLGHAWRLGDEDAEVAFGLGGTADWRARREAGVESGVQLRVLRLSGGREPELMAQFMSMYEHLMSLAARRDAGDWMRELLAHHDNLNIGLIDAAPRTTVSTESQGAFFAGLRAGQVGDRPRRVSLALSAGLKARQDRSRTETEIAGHMTTLYRDSTAQARVEVQGRASAGVQAHQWNRQDAASGRTRQVASLGLAGADLAYAAEIRTDGATHFCTLFTRDRKIDPVRTDRAFDFQDFAAFERHVRSEWASWVQYGTGKLPADMSPGMRYAVAERQLEHQLEQGRDFARHNRFATAYADKALKPAAAPVLDGLRTLAGLQRAAGQAANAHDTEAHFDDLVAQDALWEPTILMLREKPKLQRERGIDFLVKYQHNRIAESMRTVGQWPLYEPVPRRPAEGVPPRTWSDAS